MTCFIARNLLSELVDDALPSSREPELREHLAGCAACSMEFSELHRTRAMLRTLPVRRAPADFLAKVRAKAERKSALERVSIVLAPVLRLPRPAVGGLALAASLMVAVTVAIRHEQPEEGIFGYGGGPSAAKVVSGPSEPKQELAELGMPAEEAAAPLADLDASKAQDEVANRQPARDQQGDAKLAAAQLKGGEGELRKKSDASAPPPAVANGGLAREGAGAGRGSMQAAPAPVGGVSSTSPGAGTPAPTPAAKPGLYASTPGAPRPVAGAPAKSKTADAPATGSSTVAATEEQDSFASSPSAPEPAFDVESAPVVASRSAADKSAKDTSAASGKKEAKRRAESERAAAAPALESAGAPSSGDWGADASSGAGDAGGGWDSADAAPADDRADVAAEAVAPAEKPKSAPASNAAPSILNARFSSGAATGPAMVADAARAAGGKVVSGNPPSLGKSGASTNVVVEIATSAVPSFEAALDAQGTLDIQGTPSGAKVRLRIEVVRE